MSTEETEPRVPAQRREEHRQPALPWRQVRRSVAKNGVATEVWERSSVPSFLVRHMRSKRSTQTR